MNMSQPERRGATYLLAIKQRILVLHANESSPSMLARYLVEVCKLPALHRARANVARFTARNEIVKGFHRFFGGHVGIESVDLEEIEVRGL